MLLVVMVVTINYMSPPQLNDVGVVRCTDARPASAISWRQTATPVCILGLWCSIAHVELGLR